MTGLMMFIDELKRAAIAASPNELPRLAETLRKAHSEGLVSDADAHSLGDTLAVWMAQPAKERRRHRRGSRPRSPESMERRRRWAASGCLPPALAAQFTLAETAVLALVAAEVRKRGACTLTIGHLAAVAGVCPTTVRNALREAEARSLLRIEERRLTGWRNAPNRVTVTSPEWRAWLRLHHPKGGGYKLAKPTPTRNIKQGFAAGTDLVSERSGDGAHSPRSLYEGRRLASARQGRLPAEKAP
jgi:hypothetical protein